jgi:hypothetical protein
MWARAFLNCALGSVFLDGERLTMAIQPTPVSLPGSVCPSRERLTMAIHRHRKEVRASPSRFVAMQRGFPAYLLGRRTLIDRGDQAVLNRFSTRAPA